MRDKVTLSEKCIELANHVVDDPEEETVTAYVQPSDPSTAYLVEGGAPLPYLGLAGAGIVVTILGGRKLLTG
jgi:hypothetical protein